MSKGFYTTIGGSARKGIKIYAVVSGVTRAVKLGYGVMGGAARKFMEGSAPFEYTGDYTTSDITINGAEYTLYTITGSGTLKLGCTSQYWMCGGGANGQVCGYKDGNLKAGGAGGGGGYVSYGTLLSGSYPVVIGAGGSGATSIGDYTANGADALTDNIADLANGGSGGGAGGYYGSENKPTPGSGEGVSTYPFGVESMGAHCGGGGGGSYYRVGTVKGSGGVGGTNGGNGGNAGSYAIEVKIGGEKGGGNGGTYTSSSNKTDPTSATFYGSGGGGGAVNSTNTQIPGAGYQGVAYLLVPKEMIA